MIVTASTGERPLYFSVEVRDFSAQNLLTPLPYRIFNRAESTEIEATEQLAEHGEQLSAHADRLEDLDGRLEDLEEQARPFSWSSRSSDSSP